MTLKNASYFLDLASRCLSAAEDCLDRRARDEFRNIAEDLIRTANELDEVNVDSAWSRPLLRRFYS